MRKNSLIIFSFIFLTFLSVSSFSQDYTQDSLAVRFILDSNGLSSTTVISVTDSSEGRIVTLSLGLKGLSHIPSQIGILTNLTKLSLEVNSIDILPPEIGNLTKLEELVLYTNNLTVLPPAIGSCTSLKTLWISNNKLTTLPPEIGNCIAITKLIAFRNNISNLPGQMLTIYPWIECNFGYNELDSAGLSSDIVAWLNTYDPDWNTSQTVPIIYNSKYTIKSQQYLILPNTKNSLIKYHLPSSGNIRLEVLDLKGRIISTLVDAYKQAGYYSVNWDKNKYCSGIFHLRLSSGKFSVIKKAVLVK